MKVEAVLGMAGHCLHLCGSQNFEETAVSYLLENNGNVFVTGNVSEWEKRFEEKGLSVMVRKPEELKDCRGKKIVVDSYSLGENFMSWEQRWNKLSRVVCIYNLDRIDPAVLEKLVAAHDKMVLSVNNVRMLSSQKLVNGMEDVSPELVEKVVKKELDNVVLALLMTNPMCGSELVKVLYQKFKVFVSPGTLYPTLNELGKKGLLVYEYKLKNKIYRVKEKEKVEAVLKKQAEANSLITRLLAGD